MTKFFFRWAINAVALYVAVLVVPGIDLRGSWTDVLWLALSVDGFWTAVLGSLVISIVSIVMSVIFRDELKGKS